MPNQLSGAAIWLKAFFQDRNDRFLWKVPGVIHVGANTGQERARYAERLLGVVWIEANRDAYEVLVANIRPFPRQSALLGLVADRDGAPFDFNISGGDGAASSIHDLKEVHRIWPHVAYERKARLHSTTLPALLQQNGIDHKLYPALVLDTQGSELLVLRGSESILPDFRYIKTEAANFEAYAGCCLVDEISSFLFGHGFREVRRRLFASDGAGRDYYDVLYANTRSGPSLPLSLEGLWRHFTSTFHR